MLLITLIGNLFLISTKKHELSLLKDIKRIKDIIDVKNETFKIISDDIKCLQREYEKKIEEYKQFSVFIKNTDFVISSSLSKSPYNQLFFLLCKNTISDCLI